MTCVASLVEYDDVWMQSRAAAEKIAATTVHANESWQRERIWSRICVTYFFVPRIFHVTYLFITFVFIPQKQIGGFGWVFEFSNNIHLKLFPSDFLPKKTRKMVTLTALKASVKHLQLWSNASHIENDWHILMCHALFQIWFRHKCLTRAWRHKCLNRASVKHLQFEAMCDTFTLSLSHFSILSIKFGISAYHDTQKRNMETNPLYWRL